MFKRKKQPKTDTLISDNGIMEVTHDFIGHLFTTVSLILIVVLVYLGASAFIFM